MTETPASDPAGDALEKARLAALAPMDYDRVRKEAAERMGVRLPTLDAEVVALRPAVDATSGRGIVLPAIEPWPEPVEGAALLAALSDAVRRHLILSKHAADAIALWALHTWVFEQFLHTPRLTIRSPVKRCGKSTLLEVLQLVSRRPLKADNISAAGMFRVVEALFPCTLLIDEADTFLRDNEELRGIMNSGFERGGTVLRVIEVKGEHKAVQFRTFAPLAVAAIGKLPDTVEDRAVPVLLKRKAKGETVTKLRTPGSRAYLEGLARKAARWATDRSATLNLDPFIPDAMGDREGDISVPLLSIAESAGGDWPARGRAALLDMFGVRNRDENAEEAGVLLLADIRAIFDQHRAGKIGGGLTSAQLCGHLGRMEERPWPEWRHGKPMTAPQLAAALRPFQIGPGTIRQGKTTAKGYNWASFADAWSRYPLTPSSVPPNTNRHTDTTQAEPKDCDKSGTVTPPGCDGMKNGEVFSPNQQCDGVTAHFGREGTIGVHL